LLGKQRVPAVNGSGVAVEYPQTATAVLLFIAFPSAAVYRRSTKRGWGTAAAV
jgi:hypothetical protein